MRFFGLLFLCFLFLFSSCVRRRGSYNYVSKQICSPVFLAIPDNVLVFDNISPVIYKSLYAYFNQVGYRLVDSEHDSFLLKFKVKSFDPVDKFVSPDLLMYGIRLRLELECQLFDQNKKILAQKIFYATTLVCKPKNSIMNSDFLESGYQKLMRRMSPRIEQYFRTYLSGKIIK